MVVLYITAEVWRKQKPFTPLFSLLLFKWFMEPHGKWFMCMVCLHNILKKPTGLFTGYSGHDTLLILLTPPLWGIQSLTAYSFAHFSVSVATTPHMCMNSKRSSTGLKYSFGVPTQKIDIGIYVNTAMFLLLCGWRPVALVRGMQFRYVWAFLQWCEGESVTDAAEFTDLWTMTLRPSGKLLI